MLKQLIDFFETFVTDFSWRRLCLFLGLIFSFVIIFVLYENYTQSFGLAKLDKQLALTERLYDLSEKNDGSDPELIKTYERLRDKLTHNIGVTGGIVPSWLAKFIAAVVGWSILGLILVAVPDKTREHNEKIARNRSTILGMLIVGIPCAFLSTIVPTIGPWLNYILVPIVQMVVVCAAALAISKM